MPYLRLTLLKHFLIKDDDIDDDDGVQVPAEYPEFSGFIFKMQANLDPQHRDRLAYVRVISGKYEKGMKVKHSRSKPSKTYSLAGEAGGGIRGRCPAALPCAAHVPNPLRLLRAITVAAAQALFGQNREIIETAYPGDVIGINNPGLFAIGDTLYTGSKKITFPGIPSFSPEKFAYITNPNPSSYKSFSKGLSQVRVCVRREKKRRGGMSKLVTAGLTPFIQSFNHSFILSPQLLDEGAIQMLKQRDDEGGPIILAAVGQLQFEVVMARLKDEYKVEAKLEPLGYSLARWAEGGWDAVDRADADGKLFGTMIVEDRWKRPVVLFRNDWKASDLERDEEYLELKPFSLPPIVSD